ncbi:MAG TPA: glycine cleavage system protein GcvH [Syntrophomonadaceae bacterium]|nr:glycine cleavage system protein GcvH [Syntrophomonadaceae bacterium]
MQYDGYNYPDDLYYDKRHFWARVEGDLVTMGMTDYAVKAAGDLVYVEIIEPGKQVSQDKAFMSVESGKWVGRVYAQVSGEVVEINEELEFDPTLVNQDPYGEGWLVKIKMADPEELNNLLKGKDYEAWVSKEIERQKKLQAKRTGGN